MLYTEAKFLKILAKINNYNALKWYRECKNQLKNCWNTLLIRINGLKNIKFTFRRSKIYAAWHLNYLKIRDMQINFKAAFKIFNNKTFAKKRLLNNFINPNR